MKTPAVIATFVPWVAALFVYLVVQSGAASIETLRIYPWLWVFISPLWFAAGSLISYREGQWSAK